MHKLNEKQVLHTREEPGYKTTRLLTVTSVTIKLNGCVHVVCVT